MSRIKLMSRRGATRAQLWPQALRNVEFRQILGVPTGSQCQTAPNTVLAFQEDQGGIGVTILRRHEDASVISLDFLHLNLHRRGIRFRREVLLGARNDRLVIS